jgi:hypothetical protein
MRCSSGEPPARTRALRARGDRVPAIAERVPEAVHLPADGFDVLPCSMEVWPAVLAEGEQITV